MTTWIIILAIIGLFIFFINKTEISIKENVDEKVNEVKRKEVELGLMKNKVETAYDLGLRHSAQIAELYRRVRKLEEGSSKNDLDVIDVNSFD